MTSSISFNIDNLNLSKINIIQDKEAINRVIPLPPSLVQEKKLQWFLTDEIHTNYTIKGDHWGKWYAEFWLHIPQLVDTSVNSNEGI